MKTINKSYLIKMKNVYILLALVFLVEFTAGAQTIDYNFIKTIVNKPDADAMEYLKSAGYTPNKNGDFKYIADNKIKAHVTYVKANPGASQSQTYWAFQARGKKVYSPILKQIRKGAEVKEGTHYEKKRTEYKSPGGIYFYPFEDSMFDGLYWIYVSKESLLNR